MGCRQAEHDRRTPPDGFSAPPPACACGKCNTLGVRQPASNQCIDQWDVSVEGPMLTGSASANNSRICVHSGGSGVLLKLVSEAENDFAG